MLKNSTSGLKGSFNEKDSPEELYSLFNKIGGAIARQTDGLNRKPEATVNLQFTDHTL
jgi:hypothetical protein